MTDREKRERLLDIMRDARNRSLTSHNVMEHDLGLLVDALLANGVIVPPCKVGDTIYQVIGCFMAKYKVTQIRFDDIMMWFYCENKEYVKEHEHFLFDETRIGITVFLTREEAEKEAERCVSK